MTGSERKQEAPTTKMRITVWINQCYFYLFLRIDVHEATI